MSRFNFAELDLYGYSLERGAADLTDSIDCEKCSLPMYRFNILLTSRGSTNQIFLMRLNKMKKRKASHFELFLLLLVVPCILLLEFSFYLNNKFVEHSFQPSFHINWEVKQIIILEGVFFHIV